VTRGLGERVGTAAGWLYYAGVTVLLTGLLLLIGGYLQSTIQSEFSVNPLPAWAWTLIVIALITAVLYFGVRISTRSKLVLALVSIIVVTVFFIGSLRSFAGARRRFWLVVSAVLAIVITGGAIFGSFYKVTSPTILAPWFALGVLALGFLSTFVTRARRSASTQLADLSKSTA